jgi:hypothetical protein
MCPIQFHSHLVFLHLPNKGAKVTNQNSIQGEIKRRLNSGNACYHSVQNLLSSRLLSKNVRTRIYKSIILPVVLYGCETCSLALRKEYKLRVLEKKVLRKIFELKRDEVTRGWRNLYNEGLRELHFSPSIIRMAKSRRMRLAGHVARITAKRNVCRLFVGNPLGRPRRRWVENIETDLAEIGWGGVDWIGLAQDRDKWKALANAVMILRVP